MEREGLRSGLQALQEVHGLTIKTVVTDRSPTCTKMLREDFPDLDHQYDLWHITKGLGKSLHKASLSAAGKEIGPWIRSVSSRSIDHIHPLRLE